MPKFPAFSWGELTHVQNYPGDKLPKDERQVVENADPGDLFPAFCSIVFLVVTKHSHSSCIYFPFSSPVPGEKHQVQVYFSLSLLENVLGMFASVLPQAGQKQCLSVCVRREKLRQENNYGNSPITLSLCIYIFTHIYISSFIYSFFIQQIFIEPCVP